MTDGYVDAGKLELEVVADTSGLAAELRSKVEAASAGINAKIGTKVDVAALRAAVEAATQGVSGTVDVDWDTTRLRTDLSAAIAAAQAGQSVNIPVGGGGDPNIGPQTSATEKLSDAKSKLTRRLIAARKATQKLHDAQQALADAEKRSGINSDKYRRALAAVTNAQDENNDAIQRTRAAMADLERISSKGGTKPITIDVLLRTGRAKRELDDLTRPRTFTGSDDPDHADRLRAALDDLTRSQGRALTATNRLHDARQSLANAEKKHGKDSEVYRRAQMRLTQAQNEHNDAITRGNKALLDARKIASKDGTVTIPAEVELRLAAAHAELLKFLRPRELDVDVNVDKDRFTKGLTKAAGIAGKALGALIIPGFIALITGAVISLTGLAGALLAVAGAAAPALGTIGLLPAVLGGVVLAITPLIMGFGGLGDAMKAISKGDAKALAEAMKKLSPEAKKLVLQLALIRPAWAKLRKEVQNDLFKDVGKSVRALSDNYLPVLRRTLRDIASSWNFAFREVSATFNQRENINLMQRGFHNIARAGRDLAEVSSNMAQGFIDMFVTGSPFIQRMTNTIQRWTVSFTGMLNRTRKSGELTGFFERAVDKATQLGRILRDLSIGLYNFFRAGKKSGDGMLVTIESISARFREWTGSVEGQNKIASFFENTRTIARGVADAIGYISEKVAQLGGLFNRLPENVKEMIGPLLIIGGLISIVIGKVLALVPLVQLIATVIGAIGVVAFIKIIAIVVAVTAVFIALGAAVAYAWNTSEKFRTMMTTGFNTVKGIVADAWRTIKPILTQMADIFTEKIRPSIDKAIDIFSEKVTPAFREVKRVYESDVKPALQDLVKKFEEARPQIEKVAEWIGKAIEKVAAFAGSAAFGVIVGGFRTVAITIKIVVAIVSALIDLFVWVVDSAVAAPQRIKDAWGSIGEFFSAIGSGIKAGWDSTIAFFRSIPDRIGNALTSLKDRVVERFTAAVDWVRGVPARIGEALGNLKSAIAEKFTSMWASAKERSQTAIHDIVAFVVDLPFRMLAGLLNGAAALITWATNLWNSLKARFHAGVEATVAFFQALPGRISAALSTLGNGLAQWATNTWNGARARFQAGVDATVAFFRALPGRIGAAVSSLLAGLSQWATNTWNGVKARFSSGANSTVAFFRALPGRISAAVSSLLGALSAWATNTWNAVKARFSAGVNSVVATVTGLKDRVIGAITGIGSALRNIGSQIVDGLVDGIRSGVGRVREAAASLAKAIPGPIGKLLETHSPSKVTERIGRFVAQGLINGLTGSKAQIIAASRRMAGYLREALTNRSKGIVAVLGRETNKLVKLAGRYDATLTKLASAKGKLNALLAASAKVRADIAEKVRESFSLISGTGVSESISALTKRLRDALATAAAFAKNLATLKKRGLAQNLMEQLAAAGPQVGAAMAKMLAAATPEDLSKLNFLAGQLSKVADATGKTVADALYASGINAAKGLVYGLMSQRDNIEKAMLRIAVSMQKAIKKALGIKSPSTVMARIGGYAAQGLERGMLARLDDVRSAADALATAMLMSPNLLPVAAGAGIGTYARGAAASSVAATPQQAAGADIDVNVYPAAKQSEREIGLVAAREVQWGMTPR